jgi:hypothetical protein
LRSTRSLAAKLLTTVLSLTAGSADIISFLGLGGCSPLAIVLTG